MQIRQAEPDDATAIQAIYAPIVRDTTISFELEAPTVDEMRTRIVANSAVLPWLVGTDNAGTVIGYAYASKHRERAANQWSIDVTAYVRSLCPQRPSRSGRGQGALRRLHAVSCGTRHLTYGRRRRRRTDEPEDA